jgi:hypothetical protein
MKIETKFKVKDLVWFYLNGKATEAPIYKVDVEAYADKTIIQYMVDVKTNGSTKFEIIKEELTFTNKEELINSL